MEYLVTGSEMAAYDRVMIEKIGIPALVLMERAALAVYEELTAVFQGHNRVLIMAGCGNNGADGLALARMLAEHRAEQNDKKALTFDVEVVICGNPEKATEQWKVQWDILTHFPVRTGSKPASQEYDILIDALFGVGLSREITGDHTAYIQWFNESRGFKVAVDVPSGVHSDSGRIMGCAVKADLTVCFAFGKRGLYLYPGCEYAGKVTVKNIGIGTKAFGAVKPGMFRLTENVNALLPERSQAGNKGTFGKVLMAAGAPDMAGAAVMAAKSCYRTGAGMVKVLTAECNREILQSAVPEALFTTMLTDRDLEWADILAIGPGLGTDEWAYQLLYGFLTRSRLPLVIDADGLNLMGRHPELMAIVREQGSQGRTVILTPHVGELSRLTGIAIDHIKENPTVCAVELAQSLNCVIVSKDARTLICCQGQPLCLNTTGNSGMATAGSGDVLTGIIAGLLAQGMNGFEGACVGVYIHGLAGDKAAAVLGKRAMTACDLIQGVIDITKED